jgi:hypothetical protein
MATAPTYSSPQAFVNAMASYALAAQQATGINANVILAQWGNETAWGTSTAWKDNFNIAGVGITSAGVTGDDYGSVEAGVQAYINFINDNSRYDLVKQAGVDDPQAQALAMGQSGYASGGYLAEGSDEKGSALIQDMQSFTAPTGVTPATGLSVTAADGSATPAATTTGSESSNATLATSSTNIAGSTYTGTNQQTSALSTIEANLQTYGFTPAQTTQLTNWAWGEITNNVDPTQIAIDLQNQPAFQEAFPGFASANTELQKQGLPAVSVQQYQSYQTQAQAMAQAAGLPAGFINSENIGQLIGGNVSTSELSSRINNALTLAYQSTPEQQAMFNQYFGAQYGNVAGGPTGSGSLTPGQIAALALDPTVAEPLIAQQITTAQIGGAAVTSGVGALSQTTASQLAQAGITESQATSAFQNLAPYSALETARPGEGGEAAQGTVTADQLATGQLLGSPGAQRQLQQAVEVGKAPFSGGGGFVSNSKGVAGAGSASSSGSGNT